MIPVVQLLERLVALPAIEPVSGAAGAKADVLPSREGDIRKFVYRFVQNTSNNPVNYSINEDCTIQVYHGVIPVGVQLAVPCLGRVSVCGANAWQVSVLELIRANG